MKTVKCPECEAPISLYASVCPRCGCDIHRWMNLHCKPYHLNSVLIKADSCRDSYPCFKLTWDTINVRGLRFYFGRFVSDAWTLDDHSFQYIHEFGDLGRKTMYNMLRYVADPKNAPYPEHDVLTFKSAFEELESDCTIQLIKGVRGAPDLKFEEKTWGFSAFLMKDCFTIYNTLGGKDFAEQFANEYGSLLRRGW